MNNLFGRKVIKTDVSVVNNANILDVLKDALNEHLDNRKQIEYLWDYYRGKQPILTREKTVRPEICNRIVENRANEIVSFKVGYLCGEPIQLVGRNADDNVSKAIAELNEMFFSENKATQDKKLVEWQMICGTGYRLVLPDKRENEDDAPFELFVLDPRDTFVVYSNEIDSKPVLAVKYSTDSKGVNTYSIYSNKHYWKIKDKEILETKGHVLGMIPIIEYPANSARLGAFEPVLPLLDTLNNITSNRMDGIEQFVQAFMKFINCDIDENDYKTFLQLGAIKVKSGDGTNADVDMISSELNQSQTQIAKDDVYQAILEITGMPNRNGGSSTSDTGAAVVLRDGWSAAETRAKDSELMFKEAEQNTLRLILRILKGNSGISEALSKLRLKDISMKFTRRNYENIQSKAQVLDTMLKNNKIHPKLAFTSCGMFPDSEDAYLASMKYHDEEMEKQTVAQQNQPPVEE